jgi:hypothetical protein
MVALFGIWLAVWNTIYEYVSTYGAPRPGSRHFNASCRQQQIPGQIERRLTTYEYRTVQGFSPVSALRACTGQIV